MPLRRMVDVGDAIGDGELDQVERKIGKRIPQVYRDFLKINNGGTPSPQVLSVRIAEMENINLETLYGIGGDFDIVIANKYHEDILPESAVVFGCDGLGNSFFFRIDENNKNSIWFVDMEAAKPQEYRVADSFQELLRMLHS